MGMLQVVFNIEAENYYSKSAFIMTRIKQAKLVFTQKNYEYLGIQRFQILGIRFLK